MIRKRLRGHRMAAATYVLREVAMAAKRELLIRSPMFRVLVVESRSLYCDFAHMKSLAPYGTHNLTNDSLNERDVFPVQILTLVRVAAMKKNSLRYRE